MEASADPRDGRELRGMRRFVPSLEDVMKDVNQQVEEENERARSSLEVKVEGSVQSLGLFGQKCEAAAQHIEARMDQVQGQLETLLKVYKASADHMRAMARTQWEVDQEHDRRIKQLTEDADAMLRKFTEPKATNGSDQGLATAVT